MKTNPLARLGIPLSADVWSLLKKVEDTPGVKPYSFFVDSSDQKVWLVIVGESNDAIFAANRVSPFSMKSYGEVSDAEDILQENVRAVTRLEQARAKLQGGGHGLPASEYGAATNEHDEAVRDCEATRQRLDDSIKAWARRAARHDED